MTMITDGLKNESKEDEVRQLDLAEMLAESCLGKQKKAEDPQGDASGDGSRKVEEAVAST